VAKSVPKTAVLNALKRYMDHDETLLQSARSNVDEGKTIRRNAGIAAMMCALAQPNMIIPLSARAEAT
jgi:hypothetical protein